jgi:uncharacterized protein DUF4132
MSRVEEMIARFSIFDGDYFAYERRKQEAVEQVKTLTAEEQVEFVLGAVRILANRMSAAPHEMLSKPASAVLRRKLPFTAEQVLELVRMGENPTYYFPFAGVLSLAEAAEMTPELAGALRKMHGATVLQSGTATGHSALLKRIQELLDGKKTAEAFEPAGAWSKQIAAEVTPAWRAVLEAGGEITGSEPSKKWRQTAEARVSVMGREEFRRTALRWLELGPTPGVTDAVVEAKEADYQRGLLWSLPGYHDAETCAAVARFAEGCLRKIPMIGAVAQRPGNACIQVLASMEGMEPVSQLARLSLRVKYETARRLVSEALEEAARRQGISREELEEITVPAFGLDADGRRVEALGECLAELTAEGALSWRAADGKLLKGPPEPVKREFAEDLKELKQAAKEIERMRSAHRVRIERLLLSQREIPVDRWRASYVDHPMLGELARRLIWQFAAGETAIWDKGAMTSWDGREVRPEGSARLWHPLNSSVQEILSWRCWLEDHGVRQPFKQAHREVYLVTDAERATEWYSNRFAGHVLKQHPFAALCEERGWRFQLMGEWDSHNTPYVELPAFGLRAEFWVDFPRDQAVSGHAIYLFLVTDKVQFADLGAGTPRRIESIPPVVFSEVMRDVDLFVGVGSIGNDPLWGQREAAPFGDYWNQFSFGELSASAGQRKSLLEGLLPKLAIRDRCRIEERFLWVRGDRATYKIHLGSGNVLMEPGSRYLCIVQGPAEKGSPSKVFLPFEGDRTLSVILSKAFLLAEDRKIKDPAIVRQLP